MAIYGLKYRIEYNDLQGNSYKCELLLKSWTGDVTQLEGNVFLKHKAVDSVFTPLRSTSLNIDIYASINQPLSEFDVIEEFSFQCKFYRNNLQIFQGWVNPDGIFQDFVKDEWIVSLTAVDGLGSLKNLEFNPKMFGKEVLPQEGIYLFNILFSLNYYLPFAFFDDINVLFTGNEPIANEFMQLDKRLINSIVFRNKNGRYLSSEVVINDILAKYNLNLVQQNINGQLCWLIYRVPFMSFSGAKKGAIYEVATLDFTTSPYATINFNKTSTFSKNNITVFSDALAPSENLPIHCNENQQFSYEPALQNFRFTQDWLGLVNKNRASNSTFWNVTSRGEFVSDGIRVDITGSTLQIAAEQQVGTGYTGTNPATIIIEFDSHVQNFGPVITNPANRFQNLVRVRAEAFLTGDPTLYLFRDSNGVLSWRDTPFNLPLGSVYVANASEWFQTVRLEAPPLQSVIIYIDLMETTRSFPATNSNWRCVYTRINVFFDNALLGNGVFHDARRNQFRSTFLKEPVKVINSNDTNDLFLNNLYRVVGDSLDPMTSFKSVNSTAVSDLLELTSKERVLSFQKPQKIFRGDVYGFVPYFCLLQYSGLDGLFLIREYNFNTNDNVVSIEAQQIFDDTILIDYEKTYIFENEVNVLIKP
jgi:hypothetical protein